FERRLLPAGDDDLRPPFGKPRRERPPNPPAAARHERHLPRHRKQFVRHVLLLKKRHKPEAQAKGARHTSFACASGLYSRMLIHRVEIDYTHVCLFVGETMLRINAPTTGTFCDCIVRRSFLQAGLLGLGGLTLPDFLRLRAEGATATRRDTNVILVWLSGGPGHMETYDPKPEAVDQYRGPFGAIGTALPGVQFCELMPEQAKIADKLSVIRTVNHGSGDHTKGNHWMLTGFEGPAFNAPDNQVQRRPAVGSAVAKLRGANRPGMPPYVGVPHLRGGTDNLFHYATYLGGGCNPFIVNSDPNDAKYKVRDLTLSNELTLERLESRQQLLGGIDELRKRADRPMNDLSDHQSRAFDLLTSRQVRDAFDISLESPALRDTYGRHTFGQTLLLARRLVENGVTFVTANCVPWDHHGTTGQYKTEEGAKLLIPPLDKALAALLRDLIDR